MRPLTRLAPVALCLLLTACGGEGGSDEAEVRGVDLENKVVHVGILNDLSGPGAAIGRPIQVGFELLYNQVNAGGSGLLPEGWTVEWDVRDHGYNPQQSVQMYNEIRDEVLYVAMSFGTPTTLPLQPMLGRDRMLAIAASLSSRTGRNELTPVITPTYRTEAMRAVDWAVERGGTDVKLGIVYQQDDYGEDALEGLRVEADFHGVEVVSEQAIAPGQADFTAVVSGLESAGADHVMLALLPSATAPLLGTAAQLGYQPTWMGDGPAWLDRFFDPDVIPAAVFANYYHVTSTPFWGEERWDGMDNFLAAFEQYGGGAEEDGYILAGYLYAAAGIEAARLAIEAGDVSPEGLIRAVRMIDDWSVGGLTNPISLTEVPYDASRLTRVTRPLMDQRTWEVVSDFRVPLSDGN